MISVTYHYHFLYPPNQSSFSQPPPVDFLVTSPPPDSPPLIGEISYTSDSEVSIMVFRPPSPLFPQQVLYLPSVSFFSCFFFFFFFFFLDNPPSSSPKNRALQTVISIPSPPPYCLRDSPSSYLLGRFCRPSPKL